MNGKRTASKLSANISICRVLMGTEIGTKLQVRFEKTPSNRNITHRQRQSKRIGIQWFCLQMLLLALNESDILN